MALASGTLIAGRYKVLSLLGSGGMGEVYRAKDERLGREVAVKSIPPLLSDDPGFVARFEREAKVLASLSHPNIVSIHDFVQENGSHFVITELLQGETLRSRLRNSPLHWKPAIEIGISIAEGLSAAHEKGIVHRDLKPENIFITSQNRIKILDFGLARYSPTSVEVSTGSPTISQQTEPGKVLGTLPYMSPEQLRGEPVDTRSDVFSFGAVLYEMLTARRAFHRQTNPETIAAILKEDPQDISEVPAQLVTVVSRCIQKDPQKRFQSAQDIAITLKAIYEQGAGALKSEPPTRRSSTAISIAVLLHRARALC